MFLRVRYNTVLSLLRDNKVKHASSAPLVFFLSHVAPNAVKSQPHNTLIHSDVIHHRGTTDVNKPSCNSAAYLHHGLREAKVWAGLASCRSPQEEPWGQTMVDGRCSSYGLSPALFQAFAQPTAYSRLWQAAVASCRS